MAQASNAFSHGVVEGRCGAFGAALELHLEPISFATVQESSPGLAIENQRSKPRWPGGLAIPRQGRLLRWCL